MTESNKQIQVHIPPELEYCFRDIANIFVGNNEVVFEFGNHHRSTPEHATISNRIVMSLADAYELQQRLESSLMEARRKIEEAMMETA